MKKNIRIIIAVGSILGLSCLPSRAMALKEFKKLFHDRYVAPLDKEAQVVFRKAKCNVCHVQGEKRDVNNPFGEELGRRIEGDAQDRLKAAKESGSREQELDKVLTEFTAALDEVESLEAADGITYGERLRSGKLPIEPTEETLEQPKSTPD